MAIKFCSYYKCENYILDGVHSGRFSMFSFPKDEERRKEWATLANILNYHSNSKYSICSDHFDSKYICVSNRRRVLVGLAKPKPLYSTSMPEKNNVGEVFTEEKVSAKPIDLYVQQVESTTKQSDDDSTTTNTNNVSLTGKRSTSDLISCNKKKPKLPLMCEEVDTSIKTTTFILNGEEYIQMPKSLYLEEKMKLIEEIKCYKKFTSQIDSNLTELLEDI